MTINGTDIGIYGASQHHVEFGYHKLSNNSAWVRSAILPHFSKNYLDFKEMSVDVIVKPLASQSAMHPRDAIHKNVSDIIAALTDETVLKLENHSHRFRVILTGHKENEEVPRRFHKLTLDFAGYEYGDEVLAQGTGSVSITNPGNILSPLKLTIVPAANENNVTVTGCCMDPRSGADLPVILETVRAGVPVVLDGANGLFTEGDALKVDITIRALPGIDGGEHLITCSASGAALEAQLLPLYM